MLRRRKFSNVGHHEHDIYLLILEHSHHSLDGLRRIRQKSHCHESWLNGNESVVLKLSVESLLSPGGSEKSQNHIHMVHKRIAHYRIHIPCHNVPNIFYSRFLPRLQVRLHNFYNSISIQHIRPRQETNHLHKRTCSRYFVALESLMVAL